MRHLMYCDFEFISFYFYLDGSKLLYPDSLVGTDSHTTMINGLGVLGWGKFSLSLIYSFKFLLDKHRIVIAIGWGCPEWNAFWI